MGESFIKLSRIRGFGNTASIPRNYLKIIKTEFSSFVKSLPPTIYKFTPTLSLLNSKKFSYAQCCSFTISLYLEYSIYKMFPYSYE
jgi:hypothetical protein